MTPDERHVATDAMRSLTPARLALGRAGGSIPTVAHLRFRADHARARDAVNYEFDGARAAAALTAAGHRAVALASAATSRADYVRRPDLGRALSATSVVRLRALADEPCDLAIVVCDGLSPRAVERQGPALVDALASDRRLVGWSTGAVVVVSNGRVAIGDEIGSILSATFVVVLIGERPGLSVAESVGAYITHEPLVGRTDAQRNCVSNIHDHGLPIADAARRIGGLLVRARVAGRTGIGLTDDVAEAITPEPASFAADGPG